METCLRMYNDPSRVFKPHYSGVSSRFGARGHLALADSIQVKTIQTGHWDSVVVTTIIRLWE